MKRILSISCMLLAFFCSLNAQNVVPNAGFESWTDGKADNWTSDFNIQIYVFDINYNAGVQSADAHSGTSAILLQRQIMNVLEEFPVPGICQLGSFDTDSITAMAMSMINGGDYDIDPFKMVKGGTPFTEIPTKVKAWVKYTPDIEKTDALQVYVIAGKNSANGDIILAQGTYNSMAALLDYEEIEVPVNVVIPDETPDFLNIIFATSKSFDCGESELLIDDITVETETGIYELNNLDCTVSPNPAHNLLTLDLHNNLDFSVELYDLAGKKVLEQSHCNGQTSLNVSQLNAGTYLMKVQQGNRISSQKVVVY